MQGVMALMGHVGLKYNTLMYVLLLPAMNCGYSLVH